MNRKLQNTISALMTSGALLVLGLVASSQALPMVGSPHDSTYGATPLNSVLADAGELNTLAGPAALTELATAAALAAALDTASLDRDVDTPAERGPRATSSRTPARRQALAMPFFSFAPRG